jgi:hypothetical protein
MRGRGVRERAQRVSRHRCECEVDDSASCGRAGRRPHRVSGSRSERQGADSASCGRAVFDNVGSNASGVGRFVGSQHCLRGQPRGARRGEVALGVRQSTRTARRRQPDLRGAVFHNVGTVGVAASIWPGPNIVTGGYGRGRVEAAILSPIELGSARHPVAGVGCPRLHVRPGAWHWAWGRNSARIAE